MTDAATAAAGPATRRLGEPEIAGLVAARLCHDLISPAGAIGNGVELMREIGGPPGPELDLVADSADKLAASLQFLRLAFGPAPAGESAGLAGVRRIARRWFAHQRAELDWPEGDGDSTRRAARLRLNLLQAAASSLPRGGMVTMRERATGGFAVRAEGPVVAAPEPAELWLSDAPAAPPPTPRDVHWLLAGRHAREAHAGLAVQRTETALILTATPPA
ncbi:MAG TPA: histidine phosphotransferase family protein [Paracoccaceae bacterium]|nr:histidine phosphotransferase family protein [Paracoccaceae bacterium]